MGTEGPTVLEPLWQSLPTYDASSVSGSASCPLPPRYEAVKAARGFTRETLRRWNLEEEFDSIALIVSELVTNALRHGLPRATAPETEDSVRLHLVCWSARLVCAVRDPSDQPPESPGGGPGHGSGTGPRHGTGAGIGTGTGAVAGGLARAAVPADALTSAGGTEELDGLEELFGFADFEAESGRGLQLVQCFSDSWGWHPLPGAERGKIVWARFRLGA